MFPAKTVFRNAWNSWAPIRGGVHTSSFPARPPAGVSHYAINGYTAVRYAGRSWPCSRPFTSTPPRRAFRGRRPLFPAFSLFLSRPELPRSMAGHPDRWWFPQRAKDSTPSLLKVKDGNRIVSYWVSNPLISTWPVAVTLRRGDSLV